MSKSTPTHPPRRRDRLLRERVHDTYKQHGQLKEPTRCPRCGAVYHKGRWSWTAPAEEVADEQLCSACHRIADDYPAGELILRGKFVMQHKNEILNLVKNIESLENREHPMNRVMGRRDLDDGIVVTTTDLHLPRRIGTALEGAWEGTLDIHFDKGGQFTRVSWHRD